MQIGIYGYGNLARGVEDAIRRNPDMALAAVFTRRNPAALRLHTPGVPVVAAAQVGDWVGKIDVMIVCGGSATDLPVMTPMLAAQFNVVDDLAMQVHFWCADEDFPPSLELFWDENVLQYMHYETVWYANGFILEELEAQCRKLLGTESETLPQALPAKR